VPSGPLEETYEGGPENLLIKCEDRKREEIDWKRKWQPGKRPPQPEIRQKCKKKAPLRTEERLLNSGKRKSTSLKGRNKEDYTVKNPREGRISILQEQKRKKKTPRKPNELFSAQGRKPP